MAIDIKYFTAASIFFVLLLAFSYSNGLPGSYLFDDLPAIQYNKAIQIHSLDTTNLKAAALSSTSGPLKRPISMLSFALNYYATGLDPLYFKITNVLIHLLTGIGLTLLAWLLLSKTCLAQHVPTKYSHWIALLIGAIWLIHPFHVTSVLYTAQRMTSLASLFMAWGIISYIHGRVLQQTHPTRQKGNLYILLGFLVFMPLAAFSKEIGLLCPLYFLIIELCFFHFVTNTQLQKNILFSLFGVFFVLPVIMGILFVIFNPAWLPSSYTGREFTLLERLLTEPRILSWYLQMIMLPDVTQMGLHHDDIPLSKSIFSPISTLPAILAITGLIVLSFAKLKTQPVLSFGLLWFFAGHALESTIFPLELVYEHRNYLPAYGVIFILVFYLTKFSASKFGPVPKSVVIAIYVLFLAFSLQLRAQHWENPLDLALFNVKNHPTSPRSHFDLGETYLQVAQHPDSDTEKYFSLAKQHFDQTLVLNPDMVASMVLLVYLHQRFDKPLPQGLLTNIQNTLHNTTIKPNDMNAMWLLTDCITAKICKLSPQHYLDIYLAALSNNNISSGNKASLLKYMSIYFGIAMQDYDTALFYADLSLKENPNNIENYYTKIAWLIKMQKYQESLGLINVINTLDTLGKESNKLKDLSMTIANLQSRNQLNSTPE